jgi:hypothetical protein
MMFTTYQFNSNYHKYGNYNYDINKKPIDEDWMEHCEYNNFKTILKNKKNIDASYIDCELIKYCLDSLEDLSGTLLTSTYKGITYETTENVFYQIINKSNNLKNITTKHINLIDLDVLSKHPKLETINFKFYKEIEINHTDYKRESKLVIKTNNIELLKLNQKYNELNIYFIN